MQEKLPIHPAGDTVVFVALVLFRSDQQYYGLAAIPTVARRLVRKGSSAQRICRSSGVRSGSNRYLSFGRHSTPSIDSTMRKAIGRPRCSPGVPAAVDGLSAWFVPCITL
jgi:hypothetical protein